MAAEQLLPARPGWILGHPCQGFKGWLCWHSSDHTEPAPHFLSWSAPSTHSGKGHEAIHQQNTDLPQANPFHRKLGRSRVGCPGRGLPFLNRSLAAGDRFWHRTCLQHSRDVPTQHQKPKPDPLLDGGEGEARVQHSPPEARIFPLSQILHTLQRKCCCSQRFMRLRLTSRATAASMCCGFMFQTRNSFTYTKPAPS